MTSSNRLLLLFPLLFGIALPLAAQRQLNPTVTVLREATGPVPADCVDERATPAPRVDVAEMQREAATADRAATERLAPPSADLRGRLRSAQSALAANDRTSFVAALTSARSMLASYPTGAERDAAAELIRVYEDAARVWDYQFESPTGAFFDESSELFAIASAYPGYREAVRRQVIERGGTRYYPSAETRAFLGRAAAERASRLGIRASATTNTRTAATPSTGGGRTDAAQQAPRSTRDTTRDTAARNTTANAGTRQPASGTRSTSATAGTRVAGRDRTGTASPDSAATQRPGRSTSTTSRQATRRAPATSVASADDRPSRPATQRSTSSPPRAAAAGGNAGTGSGTAPSGGSPATSAVSTTPSGGASSPAASSPTPADTATAAPSPSIEPTVTSTPATPFETTTDTATTDTTQTDTTTTDTTQTDTTATAVTATAPARSDTAPATPPAGGKSRSLLWPAVVVLITVGVLVLLFRASD